MIVIRYPFAKVLTLAINNPTNIALPMAPANTMGTLNLPFHIGLLFPGPHIMFKGYSGGTPPFFDISSYIFDIFVSFRSNEQEYLKPL